MSVNTKINITWVHLLTTYKLGKNLLICYWKTIQKHQDSFFVKHLEQMIGLFKLPQEISSATTTNALNLDKMWRKCICGGFYGFSNS